MLISKIRSSVDLTHILFGNLLGISDADLVQTVVISAVCQLVLLLLRRDLLLFCFDPSHASTIGLNTGVLHYLLLTLVSLAAPQNWIDHVTKTLHYYWWFVRIIMFVPTEKSVHSADLNLGSLWQTNKQSIKPRQ